MRDKKIIEQNVRDKGKNSSNNDTVEYFCISTPCAPSSRLFVALFGLADDEEDDSFTEEPPSLPSLDTFLALFGREEPVDYVISRKLTNFRR